MLIEPTKTRPNRAAPLPLARLCIELENIAARQGLPGKGGPAAASAAPSRVASDGGEKTPRPAPSADVLRLLLAELPNAPGGPFDDRGRWVEEAIAIKGASIAAGIEVEGREAFVQWSQKWGGDPDEPGRVWDSLTNPHMGWGRLKRTLRAVNPAGAARVEAAEAQAAFAQTAAQTVAALSARPIQPVQPFVPGQIDPRQWVFGHIFMRGVYSLLVASGGSGKSALTMVEAIAMATGRELIPGHRVWGDPKTVWYHNGEDSQDEQLRRLAAAMLHYGITHADLGGRLILTSGHDHPIKLGGMGPNGPELTPGAKQWIVETARSLKVDVLILDPLGAVHGLPENSNEALNLLANRLTRIAIDANIAIGLVHHVSQAAAGNMRASGANAARGGTALVDRSRITRQISRPDEKEAPAMGIKSEERWRYLAIGNGKANNAPLSEAKWVKLVSVSLGNGTADYPAGDEVQTVEHWMPPRGLVGASSDLARLQDAIRARAVPPRFAPQAPDWVGYLLADLLGWDAGRGSTQAQCDAAQIEARARVKEMIQSWIASGGLVVETRPDPKGKHGATVSVVQPGLPAVIADDPDADADAYPVSEDPDDQDGPEERE